MSCRDRRGSTKFCAKIKMHGLLLPRPLLPLGLCVVLLIAPHTAQAAGDPAREACVPTPEVWTTPSLAVYLKSTDIRRASRDTARYRASILSHSNKLKCTPLPTDVFTADWESCLHSSQTAYGVAGKANMLACARGALSAVALLDDRTSTRELLAKAVTGVVPPNRWVRIGIAAITVALLKDLQTDGRTVNLAFLAMWQRMAGLPKSQRVSLSRSLQTDLHLGFHAAAARPDLDSGIPVSALKAVIYRNDYGPATFDILPDVREAYLARRRGSGLAHSESVPVMCGQVLDWLQDRGVSQLLLDRQEGRGGGGGDSGSSSERLSYPTIALLGVFQNLLFNYELSASQQPSHTFSLFAGERAPKYTLSCIEYLEALDLRGMSVFEYGAGGSTLWWSQRVRSVTSVDTNQDWVDSLEHETPESVKLMLRSEAAAPWSIAEEAEENGGGFDIVLIDGAFSRYESALATLGSDGREDADTADQVARLAQGGFVLLDDADWYPRTSRLLRERGDLIQVDFHGPKPGDGAAWRSTSLYLHRDFVAHPPPGMVLPRVGRGGIRLGSSWDA